MFAEFAAPVNSGSCPISDLLARFDKSGRKVGRALDNHRARLFVSLSETNDIRARFAFRDRFAPRRRRTI